MLTTDHFNVLDGTWKLAYC